MNSKTNPPRRIVNHGLVKPKSQTQFAYVFLFLAAPAILACAAAFLHLTRHDTTQVYQMLWLCASLLIPSFFAGLSFWLLAHNNKYAKASLLTCMSYAIVAAIVFIVLMNVENRSYKADAFFLLGILVFGFLITMMTAIIISIVPNVRYGKLALFILIVLLAALFLPVKQAMQGQGQGQMPPGHAASTHEVEKIQNALVYAFQQKLHNNVALCNPTLSDSVKASVVHDERPAALVVGETAVCVPIRYANMEAFRRLNPDCCTLTTSALPATTSTPIPAPATTSSAKAPTKEAIEYVQIQYKYNELNQQQTATYVVELDKQGKPTRGFDVEGTVLVD